jgi:flagellar motor protein MotB
MGKINFGATIHRVVRLDLSDAAFEPVKPTLRPEWRESLQEVIEQLKTGPSILRLSYLGDAETNAMAKARVDQVRETVMTQWQALNLDHQLTVETELFWRRGKPGGGGRAAARDGMSFSHLDDNVVVSDIGENTEYLLPDANFTLWSSGKGEFSLRDDDTVHFQRRVLEDVTRENVVDRVNAMSTVTGEPDISPTSVSRLKVLLSELGEGKRLRLHFVGHTDDQPLSDAAKEQYADGYALSRAQAKMAADYFRRELNLASEQVTYDGKGGSEPLQSNISSEGQLANRRVEVQLWVENVTERTVDEPEVVPPAGVKTVRVCRREPACIVVRKNKDARRMVVNRPVDPIRFDQGTLKLNKADIEQLRVVVNRYRSKPNWQLRFTGHVDSMPISRDARARYGDKQGLSRAHARVAARQVQQALGLEDHQVVYEGVGDTQPIADNALPSGRARNRRVTVALWFDAPEDVLSVSEPQVCPTDADGRDHIAERYLPGGQDPIGPVTYRGGKPVINDQYLTQLNALLERLQDKRNLRIVFAGYTESMLLNRRAAQAYGDNWGLAEARAKKVRDEIQQALKLPAEMLTIEGKGLDESGVIDQGRVLQSPEGYVDIEIWFDVPVPLDENVVAELIKIQRRTDPVNPFSLAPMRVTVDGKRLDASLPHSADVQRCTDVALEQTNIQLRFDGHQTPARLTVTGTPTTIAREDNAETPAAENRVTFQGYTNYPALIAKSEIRLFRAPQSLDDTPHDVIKLDERMRGIWSAKWNSAAEYKYVLRVYDSEGRFDETNAQPIRVVKQDALLAGREESTASASQRVYGESKLARRNIPMTGGTVTVNADAVPKGHQVWIMSKPAPVDENGKLVSQQIIPKGLHTVEVAVLDPDGNGQVYLRDLGMTHGNWFYTGIADVTVGMDQTTGPASLVSGDDTHYNSGMFTDGRFAFYAKGSTRKGIEITTSVDTEEGDLGSLFSNIMDKNPRALFRRLDQDYEGYVYPTFGDDSTTTEDAPTQGKMYFKARKGNNFGVWGNFKAHWLDTDLARVDRGLYGAYGHYQSSDTTSFGEARTRTDTFVAEPGTVRGREEFRGTGGSLYFLRHQDITQGSESVWVEVRDQDSGLVLKTNRLVPGTDYTVDAIQGRVQLSAPLPSTADASQLVQAGSLSGHPVFLVVNYEYVPGLDELESSTVGLRASRWMNDDVKLGFTYHNEDQAGQPQNLTGVDFTWRRSAATYLKFETAVTEGMGEGEFASQDGGYNFDQVAQPATTGTAGAQRVELVGQMQDFVANSRGRFTAYFQQREAGFSAPGQVTSKDTLQFGGSYTMSLDKFSDFNVKLDSRSEELGLSTQALSADYGMLFSRNWKMTAGIRHDSRDDNSVVIPTTQTEGDRTDAAVRMTYEKDEDWKAYYFAQATLQRTGTRNANNRLGGGAEYQVNDKLSLLGELSTGDLGMGAKFGADYKLNDNSNLYSTYALDNERDVGGLRVMKGNFVSGFRAKTSESMSIYGEERYVHGDVPTGLTHAYGVELAPDNDWRYGAAFETGSLRDPNTAAVTDRTALSFTAAHTNDDWRYSGAVEYRVDDTTASTRTTYLLKNRLMYQTDPNWNLFGKFNYSDSSSTQGEFYDGKFIETVFGYAFRPVDNDRWNTVMKYTYFHNLPSADQMSGGGTAAEYIQRSHVFAVDTSFDLNKRWTIGGKLAYRMGELSMDRVNPEFFSNRGQLIALRADWHLVHDWDLTIEGRLRNELDAEDARTGMLIGAYHHLGNNLKIGGGYNFADFSDDLTNMDYTTQGLFINIIGKF